MSNTTEAHRRLPLPTAPPPPTAAPDQGKGKVCVWVCVSSSECVSAFLGGTQSKPLYLSVIPADLAFAPWLFLFSCVQHWQAGTEQIV